MAPKLYMFLASPPARAVMLCAKALGVELDLVNMKLHEGDHLRPEYLKMNPQHTIPTFVDDDNFVIWDSHAIMIYLVEKYGKSKSLYPPDIKQRAKINQILHFDTGILFSRGTVITKGFIFKKLKTIPQEASDDVKEAYGYLENHLQDSKFVAGNELTIADFSIVATLVSWDLLVPLEKEKYPNISQWRKRMEGLPYYETVNRPSIEMLKKMLRTMLPNKI